MRRPEPGEDARFGPIPAAGVAFRSTLTRIMQLDRKAGAQVGKAA